MTWRLARSLTTLRAQVDALAPTRSKRSDGTIGDPAHAARKSAHNPTRGVVHAWDCTHDPGRWDAHKMADRLLAGQDRRLRLVISNGRIGSGPGGPSPGKWRPYTGSNPHRTHAHVEAVTTSAADDPRPWALGPLAPPEDIVTPQDIEKVAQRAAELVAERLGQEHGRMPLGHRLDEVRRNVRAVGAKLGLSVDGDGNLK